MLKRTLIRQDVSPGPLEFVRSLLWTRLPKEGVHGKDTTQEWRTTNVNVRSVPLSWSVSSVNRSRPFEDHLQPKNLQRCNMVKQKGILWEAIRTWTFQWDGECLGDYGIKMVLPQRITRSGRHLNTVGHQSPSLDIGKKRKKGIN